MQYLIVAIASIDLFIGFLVLIRNSKKLENISFFLFTLLAAIWIIANYFGSAPIPEGLATFFLHLDFASGVLLSSVFLFFASEIGGVNKKARLTFLVSLPISILTAVLVFTNQIFTISFLKDGVEIVYSNLGNVYEIVLLINFAVGFSWLIYKRHKAKGLLRNQFTLMLLGLLVTIVFAVTTNVILPSMIDSVGLTTAIQRFSYSGILFFIGITAYTIVKHRLFDIRLIVARTIAYSLLLISLAGIYSLTIFGVTSLFFSSASTSSTQNYLYVALAIVLAFTFQPLRRFFERVTDKIFYRDKYDAQKLINDIGKILASYILLDRLATHVLTTIKDQMRVLTTDLIVIDAERVYFEAQKFFVGFHDSLLHNLNKFNNPITVFDQLEEGELKEIMRQYGMSVIVRLSTRDQIVGYLLLSEKLNGDIYNDGDINVLQIIGDELAVAIENAKSYTKIQRFNLTLQEKVKEATAELRAANEHLLEVDKAKDDFISMASHQLKTPVTAINGYAEMLSQGRFGDISDKQKEAISKLLDRSNDVMAQVTDLLSVSRIDSGKFHFDPKPTDLNELVAKQVEQLQVRAKMNGTELTYTPAPTPVPVLTLDTEKTRQAILNLVDNAIFYAAKGHVKVSLGADATDIIYKVVDDGIGVPEDVKPKLFGKYVRADNAKDERPDGTGLGLYLVKKVVEEQGGEIIFESQVGKGSTFGFRLPLTLANQTPQPPDDVPPSGVRPLPLATQTYEQSKELEQRLAENKHATT